MNDQDTYKRRSIILSHDSDCFHHVEEMRRWRDHLVNNANNKHKDKLNLAELEFNLEYNPLKLWRPWFRLEDSYDYLQGATNVEYREIMKKMIFNCEDSAKDIGRKKRIMLIKQKVVGSDEVEVECWIKLTNPADEINLEIINDEKKIKEKTTKKKNHIMAVGKLQDNFNKEDKIKKKIGKLQDTFNHEDKIKKKIGDRSEKRKTIPIRRQKTRRVFIQTLHNLTFGKEDHFGL